MVFCERKGCHVCFHLCLTKIGRMHCILWSIKATLRPPIYIVLMEKFDNLCCTTGKAARKRATPLQTQQTQACTAPVRDRSLPSHVGMTFHSHITQSDRPHTGAARPCTLAMQQVSAVRRSPKFTKLRDQHLPGEVLHQCTTFRSTVHVRHEAACHVQPAPQPLPSAGMFCSAIISVTTP